MIRSVTVLRWILWAGVLVVSLWILGQQTGLVGDACSRECDTIRDSLLSAMLPSVSVALALVLGVGYANHWNTGPLQRIAAVGAVLLVSYSLLQGAFCRPCFAVNTLWVALAATELKPRFVYGSTVVALAFVGVILSSLERFSIEGREPVLATLTLRGQEAALPGKADSRFVVFLDPVCPHCRKSFPEYFERRDRIYLRWFILSSHFAVAREIAEPVESLMLKDTEAGWAMLKKWYESPESSQPSAKSVKSFCEGESLRESSREALTAIGEDGLLAEQLDLQEVPGFAVVLDLGSSKLVAERISKKAFLSLVMNSQ